MKASSCAFHDIGWALKQSVMWSHVAVWRNLLIFQAIPIATTACSTSSSELCLRWWRCSCSSSSAFSTDAGKRVYRRTRRTLRCAMSLARRRSTEQALHAATGCSRRRQKKSQSYDDYLSDLGAFDGLRVMLPSRRSWAIGFLGARHFGVFRSSIVCWQA